MNKNIKKHNKIPPRNKDRERILKLLKMYEKTFTTLYEYDKKDLGENETK